MTCAHPNIRLNISWTEVADTAGPEVETYRIKPGSLRVDIARCPDCGLARNVYTSNDGWRERWPTWLCYCVRQLAESHHTVRLAVRTCLPGLISETKP